MKYRIFQGDCVEEMAKLPADSVDAIVTDPPYGLKFMGKEFDNLGEGAQQREWHRLWAVEALRVLKPGGHLIAFGGTRTYHHLATAVEEAGFEIRDQIQWLYGSGFPKSLNVGKAIDKKKGKKRKVIGKKKTNTGMQGNNFNTGSKTEEIDITAPATKEAARWEGWGTALKPANEPVVVARKPLEGTVAENVLEHGTGAINIEEARIGGKEGRWPANVILDEEAGQLLDEQSGTLKSGKPGKRSKTATSGSMSGDLGVLDRTEPGAGDQGGASRFFYCPKAGKKERNAGLEEFEEKEAKTTQGLNSPEMRKERGRIARETTRANTHPTVKPVALMAYLIRLVTPSGGTVLDPFLGSGSTGCAASQEECVERFIGIEQDPDYIKIARARIKHWKRK